jgi:hypothetical protein
LFIVVIVWTVGVPELAEVPGELGQHERVVAKHGKVAAQER